MALVGMAAPEQHHSPTTERADRMNRTAKWVGLLGVAAALASGPGCMLFDEDYDDDYDRPYERDTRRASPPVEDTRGQPGVYQDKR